MIQISKPSVRAAVPYSGCSARVCRSRCARLAQRVRAEPEDVDQRFGLAPSEPSTPFGQMMAYYLKMKPELFRTAIEDQFMQLKADKEAREEQERKAEELRQAAESKDAPSETSTDLTLPGLSDRIQEVQEAERRATVEDLMYMCVLEEFIKLGVGMLPRTDNYTDVPAVAFKPLMEDVHSNQAMELVREHLLGMMGEAAAMPPTVVMKTSKIQMLQVYLFSVMFGYYLRRVDQRFQLAKSTGFLPEDPEDAVSRLERLFTLESDPEDQDDVKTVYEPPDSPSSSKSAASDGSGKREDKKSALKRYIDSFDAETTRQMTSVMSKEAASLLNRQAKALWGDLEELTEELKEAVGAVTSPEEAQEAFQDAIKKDQVQTVTMFVSTQRRAVLEAVAFGTFVRDTELYVDGNYGLLTPNPSQPGGPGLLPPA